MAISHCYCYSLPRLFNWQSSYVVGFHSTPADYLAPADHLTLHLQIYPLLKWQSEIHTDISLLWQLRQTGKCQSANHTDTFLLWQQLHIHTPYQLSIYALSTVTPNLADLLADLPPPPWSIEHRCLEYCYTKLGRSTGRSTPFNWA